MLFLNSFPAIVYKPVNHTITVEGTTSYNLDVNSDGTTDYVMCFTYDGNTHRWLCTISGIFQTGPNNAVYETPITAGTPVGGNGTWDYSVALFQGPACGPLSEALTVANIL